jgi:hypothetical protein
MRKLAVTTAIAVALATAAYAADRNGGGRGPGPGIGGGGGGPGLSAQGPGREAPDLARRADRAAQRPAWDPIVGPAVSTTAHQQT